MILKMGTGEEEQAALNGRLLVLKRRKTMRRRDREISQPERIDEIIMRCDCCRLGFSDGKNAYIVPMNFGFLHRGRERFFYFHSAREGRKIDLIRRNGRAGFELDTFHGVNTGDSACSYSFRFQSVIGEGEIALVEEKEEKETALSLLMEHYTGKNNWSFQEKELEGVAVIRLRVTELSCKMHE